MERRAALAAAAAAAGEEERRSKDKAHKEEEEDDDDHEDELEEEEKKRRIVFEGFTNRRGSNSGSHHQPPSCQAERCSADLTNAKRYHRRHKVCEVHAKAAAVLVAGIRQRFCQQCSRFHELSEFDETKRSCRRRLAGHNERRRKSSNEGQGDGGGGGRRELQEKLCRPVVEQVGRMQMSLQGSSTYKHFQIR